MGSPVAFPKIDVSNLDNFIEDVLNKAGVLLLPGKVYDLDKPFFRVGLGRLQNEEAIRRLDGFLSSSKY